MNRLRNKVTLLFLIVGITGILGTAIVTTRIFVKDKREYVMGINSLAAPKVAEGVSRHLDYLQKQFEVFDGILAGVQKSGKTGTLLQTAFEKLDGVEQLNVYDAQGMVAGVGSAIEFDQDTIKLLFQSKSRRLISVRTRAEDNSSASRQAALLATWVKDRLYLVLLSPKVFSDFFEGSQAMAVMLISGDGTIILSNSTVDSKVLSVGLSKELIESVKFREKHSVIARRVEAPDGVEMLAAVAPISGTVGNSIVVQDPATTAWEMAYRIFKVSIPFIVGILILSVVMGFLFSGQLVHPIEELTRATSEISHGNWKVDIKTKEKNEIGTLVNAFNHMGEELGEREVQLEKANKELMKKEKLASLGQFGAGIAHEVKNPLNSILGFAQLSQQKLKGDADPSIVKWIGFILSETRRASGIITDILTFARQKEPSLARIKLTDFIKHTDEMSQPQAQMAKVELKSEVIDDGLEAEMDKDQIYQVISNLITNACHAMEEKPEGERHINLKLSKEENQAHFEVIDTGTGISKENIDKIFEPFFSTKKTGKGTGLGLSLCHGIVVQHNGSIDVTSEVGVGTTFHIRLPLANA